MEKQIEILEVLADPITGLWISHERSGEFVSRALWDGKADTDHIHYDIADMDSGNGQQLFAVKVCWVD